jgi:hypothetical protein
MNEGTPRPKKRAQAAAAYRRDSGIPEDVELMANELTRVCAKHRVCLTAFAFRYEPGTPFMFHFGTIEDTIENIRETNEKCVEALDLHPNPTRTVLRKNDA